MDSSIDSEAEDFVHTMADAITAPLPRECLPCYLDRMLRDLQCDGSLRLTRNYRDATAPRATALEHRVMNGGGYCDCEVLMNVFIPHDEHVMPCGGVRRGSTQPCSLWSRHRRGMPWF
ncbi:DUF2695 domain-containing protein [Humibacter albus]|jgi:hypothetical protein|uniref:DUF2695 domain-containing protein n=1 Tax=Humibacter albus TaxID=427754 RepID=UPI0003B359AD|nr:DUF2695 domain-containing protein [Humibacter albus]